jgi:SAM-dependent methyltransferase
MGAEGGPADFYNEAYKKRNYFQYSTWLYAPYISSLIAFCGLRQGASILDVGCGQGLFSYLFSRFGMKVHGIDSSEAGVRAAENLYGRFGAMFSVADAQCATFSVPFDCIFVRSCSLYNKETFAFQKEVTQNLLKHLKNQGIFIFAYNSNFSSKASPKWRYHSLADVKQHFSDYLDAKFFFVNKLTLYFLRGYAFMPTITSANILLSKIAGIGGDLVCVFKKSV